jgi:predicted regulator of Ras-like GTPase activity (Roadblock/LC7/MglB family)
MDAYTGRLVEAIGNIDGAFEGVFCGYDGLIIATHIIHKTPLDVELICANYVSVINTLKKTGNDPRDIITTFEKHTIYLKVLKDCFVVIIMGVDGNLGRAKLECSKLAKDFGA